MQRFIIISFLLFSSFFSFSQFSYSEAIQKSRLDGNPILLVFSGADWCRPCIALKKNVLDDETFKSISGQLTLLYVDFPYKKKNQLSGEKRRQNESLAEKYNPEGLFPKIILIDHTESLLGEILYHKDLTAHDFILELEDLINEK